MPRKKPLIIVVSRRMSSSMANLGVVEPPLCVASTHDRPNKHAESGQKAAYHAAMESAGMTLRPITEADGDEVAFIFFAAWSDANHFISPRDDFASFRSYVRNVVVKENRIWVLQRRDSLVGFVALAGNTLDHLYVHPLHHRLGYGRRLLDHAKAMAGGHLQASCFMRNRGACEFYRKLGFTIVGTSLVESYGHEPAYNLVFGASATVAAPDRAPG